MFLSPFQKKLILSIWLGCALGLGIYALVEPSIEFPSPRTHIDARISFKTGPTSKRVIYVESNNDGGELKAREVDQVDSDSERGTDFWKQLAYWNYAGRRSHITSLSEFCNAGLIRDDDTVDIEDTRGPFHLEAHINSKPRLGGYAEIYDLGLPPADNPTYSAGGQGQLARENSLTVAGYICAWTRNESIY